MAEKLAELPEADRLAVLRDYNVGTLEWDPNFWLRPEQLDAVNALTWLILLLAGRGAGKTRVLSEWVREKAKTPNTRIALVARTVADVRDTMVTGASGILAISPPSERPEYIPSARTLRWPNGSVALTFSAEKPDQLRGPQFHATACDEIASWRQEPDASGLNAWDNVKIATRLGRSPQIMAATTPKRIKVIRSLIQMSKDDSERIHIFRSATADNLANLSADYISAIYEQYAGTSIARQELFGEVLDDVEGALWQDSIIDPFRSLIPPDILGRDYIRVVGVDPSVAAKPGDECGIVVCASTKERPLLRRQAWVLADESLQGSPDVWAKTVARTARRWGAIVVAEQNQGGDLVRMAIQGVDSTIPVILVHATKGKAMRSEPIVMAYEQERAHHVGASGELALLEDEMTSWVPGESGYSPNRLDALVWALHSLLVDDSKIQRATGTLRTTRRTSAMQINGAIPGYRRTRGVDRRFTGHRG